ncbi:transposase [Thermodesulfovibrio hydrogeniphilus]
MGTKKNNSKKKTIYGITLKKEEWEVIQQFGLENFIKEIAEMPPQESIKVLAEMLFNLLMKKERDFFVEADSDNKSNGFYQRQLGCMFGNLNLSVPRDRQGRFRSAVLPPHWKRFDKDFEDFILNLILQSYSPSKIKSLPEKHESSIFS